MEAVVEGVAMEVVVLPGVVGVVVGSECIISWRIEVLSGGIEVLLSEGIEVLLRGRIEVLLSRMVAALDGIVESVVAKAMAVGVVPRRGVSRDEAVGVSVVGLISMH